MQKILTRFFILVLIIPLLLLGAVLLNNILISNSVKDKIYNSIYELPSRKYTLVLGGGNSEPGQWENHTFINRMKAAIEIYNTGKTEIFIVSGISNQVYYNEPNEMKKMLTDAGVPSHRVYPDHGGIRTWVSLLRVKEYYKKDTIIIVSQQQQLERALFSAGCLGINAIGYVAEPQPYTHRYWKLREYLSRMKCVLDCIAFKLKIT